MLLLAACVVKTALPIRIALLAPFEGRYREIGYNALYAARLALRDVGDARYELLPVDDGGTVASAVGRARALALDPYVSSVIVLGYDAASPETQAAYGDLPVLVVGNWDAPTSAENVFILSHVDVVSRMTVPPRLSVTEAANVESPVVGGEIFGLEQFPLLRDSLDGIIIVTSGSLPDDDFSARYRAGEQFAPEPGLLATLTYDATRLALLAVAESSNHSREDITARIRNTQYNGPSGHIRFENGYWQDAPIHMFEYNENGQLRAVDDLVEQR